MSRQESRHASVVDPTEKHRRQNPAWRREARPEAVLGPERQEARRRRQEARPEAVWAARRPRKQVLLQFCSKMQVVRRRQGGCSRSANLQKRKAELRNFCID